METIIAITILVVGLVVVYIMWIGSKKHSGPISQIDHFPKQSPYEKHLVEHATDWNIRWQRKELIRHTSLLNEANAKGDRTSVKIHRSMIVYSRSVLNHLYQKLREVYLK